MVRIAHLADTHLGLKPYNLEEREKDIFETLDEIGDKILEERADIVIHSGDLFDSPRPTTQAYYALKKFLRKIEDKTKIFAVLGDHDRPKARGMPPHILFDDQIQILGKKGSVEKQTLNINGERIVIAGISNLSRTYNAILLEELKKLEKIDQNSSHRILAMHQAIDTFLPFEGAWEIPFTSLPKTFDYIAMGHIHTKIKASCGKGELAYPGSSDIIRKDEISSWEKKGKGFYIIDLNNDETIITDVNLESIRPQLRLKINYSNLENEAEEIAGKIKTKKKLPIAHIRVEGKEIDRQRVHEVLNNTLSGKVLSLRPTIIEESYLKLPEVKPGAFNVKQVLKDYFKEKEISDLSIELLNHLRESDIEGANDIAEKFYKNIQKESEMQ